MSAGICIRSLNFAYSKLPVLENINLEIEAEEFFGLIGPNAAGKSTLIKLLLGLLMPDSGEILIKGQPPLKARHLLGYVPQHPTFPCDFPITVEEVVMLGRQSPTYGWFDRQDRQAARVAMQAVEIADIARQPIKTISGGQRQRMLIARALISHPEILILDEPTANIDLQAEESIFSLLKQYNDHITIIVISHDVAFISEYVHRVGCLNKTLICHATAAIDGKIIAELYGGAVRMIQHVH